MSVAQAVSGETNTVPFASQLEVVRDYIRYELVRRRLGAIAGAAPQNVIAVGGESALDALWLAGQGHKVTVIDANHNKLGHAEERLGRLASRLLSSVRLQATTPDDLLAGGGKGTYDIALCHKAAMYDSEPGTLIHSVGALVRAGGHLSLLERGFDGTVLGLLRSKRYADADSILDTERMSDDGAWAWAFRPRWLTHAARDAGATSFDWYGVCVTRDFDARRVAKLPGQKLEVLVDEQEHAGQRHDLCGAAPLLHLIGKMGGVLAPRASF